MRRKSIKSKLKKGYGQGSGKDYKPFIGVREVGSLGTCSIVWDWKTGRSVELLSQGEMLTWYILRWNDDNIDIREQVPLDLEVTTEIARKLGIKHPKDNKTPMTTDFLVTSKSHEEKAISVKCTRKSIEDNVREQEKLTLEILYWKHKGIPIEIWYKETNY